MSLSVPTRAQLARASSLSTVWRQRPVNGVASADCTSHANDSPPFVLVSQMVKNCIVDETAGSARPDEGMTGAGKREREDGQALSKVGGPSAGNACHSSRESGQSPKLYSQASDGALDRPRRRSIPFSRVVKTAMKHTRQTIPQQEMASLLGHPILGLGP